MDKDSLARIRTVMLGVVALFCGGMVLLYAKSVIEPLLLAFFACLLLNPLVKKLESFLSAKLKIPKWIATAAAVPIALLLAALLMVGFGLIFYANLAPIFEAWPRYLERGTEQIDRILGWLRDKGLENATWETLNKQAGDTKVVDQIQKNFAPGPVLAFLTGGITSFLGFLGQAFLVLIYTIFMLFEAAEYRKKAERVFGEKSALIGMVEKVSVKVQIYLNVKTLMSFLTGAFTALACALFGVDFALFWGVFAFAINYIPYLGSVVAVVFPALLALFQYDNPLIAIGLLIVLTVIQNGIGTVLEPKVMGDKMSISPLVLLFSLVFWGWLWGVVGMILSAVFAVGIQLMMREHPYFKQWSRMMDATASDKTRIMIKPGSDCGPPTASSPFAPNKT